MKHKGTTFDSFIENAGIADETEAAAIKKVAYHLMQSKLDTKSTTVKKDQVFIDINTHKINK